MEQDHLRITGDSLAQYLTDQGFRVTVHNTAINTLRMWLAEAGVFNKGGALWQVNKARQEQLLGLTDDTIAALVGLNEEQRAFVEALCRINPAGRYPAADVRALAATIIGRSFGQGSLPNAVLEPLKRAGLIDYETRGTRGGKSARLWTLPAFDLEVLDPFIRETVRTLDPALTAYFTKRPADIYADLDSADTFIKGHGLEAFAIYIMRLLGLRFVDWRKRGNDTGGAEIDVVMTGLIGVQPAVWQIQCKNTPSGVLRLEEVAKEVGLLPQTKATNILILANCRIAPDAYRFAQKTMRDGPTNIYLIDKAGYERIRQNPVELAVILREQAEQIRQLRHDVLTSTLSS